MTPENGKVSPESQELYRLLAENSTDMISKHTLEGVYTYVSPACRSLLGYEPEDLVGRSVYEFLHPGDVQRVKSVQSTIPQRPDVHTVNYRVWRKDGSYTWFETTGRAVREPGTSEIIAVSRDISERKRAEEALQESNERLTNTLESITDAFFAVDHEWRFTYLNRQAERTLRRKRQELLGRSLWEEFPEAVGAKFYQKYHEAAESGISVHFEEFYAPLGHWAEVHAYPSKDGLAVYFRDVSERKRTEEALYESEKRFKALYEDNPSMYFTLDAQGTVLSVNRFGAEQLGYAPEELVGRPVLDIFYEEDREEASRYLGTCLQGESKTAGYEARKVRKDGSVLWVAERVRVVRSPDGGRVILAACEDVTERKRVEKALEREIRAKSDFLADVSHELRTPLTVIRGNAEVGLELGRGWAHADLLEEIVKESGMMSRMVEDLLFLARSNSDSFPLDLETISVAHILDGLGRRAEALVREHGASLKTTFCTEGSLRCDPERIEQAVLVLVDNAVKYGPPGEQITLSSSTLRGELLIEVADRGPGIPPEELSRVFERYYRGEGSSHERGSGLGLPIAEAIVRAHGGRVEAESRVGEGTRMLLRLPLTEGS